MALEALGVSLRLGDAHILKDVSVALSPGDFLAVAGPNGAGKTTLLRCLAGVCVPQEGHVRLDDVPLAAMNRRGVARRIAYCPQDSEDRFGFTVRQSVLMGRHPWMLRFAEQTREDREAVETALAAMDLEHLAHRASASLSGGERRRTALARTLAQGGGYFLFDEPVAGLDIRHALAAMRCFRRLAAQGAGVAVVLHDLNLAAMFCPLTVLIAGGRAAAYGPTPAVLTSGAISRVFGVRAEVSERFVRFLEE